MTAIALPRPWYIPDWSSWLLSGTLGLILAFATFTSNVYQVDVGPLPVFPTCEGYGCETIGGRGGVVCRVTNVNDTGAGSFRNCMTMTVPRIIIFRVSGTIQQVGDLILTTPNSFVSVFGQTAPGDGIALQMTASDPERLLELGIAEVPASAFSDGVFQHLRFRHGSPGATPRDAIAIYDDGTNIVFDHNSFTWTGDERIEVWGSDIHNITFSHNVIAEGVVFKSETTFQGDTRNMGPLHSGPSGQPREHWDITYHHNLFVHSFIRNIRTAGATPASGTSGFQLINNVNYNNSTHMINPAKTDASGSNDFFMDIINAYFKRGPDGNPWPIRWGISQALPNDSALNLHFVGSTWRNQDGTPHVNNDEADNYNMMLQNNDFWTLTERATPLTSQPEFPVTITSAAQAYIDVVVNEDVGATKPSLDAVDQRLVDAPEDETAWSSVNIPPPHGTATRQTFVTSGVPVDTDSDGVPDAFETTPLGTDPNVFEEQAQLDHDGDGYVNIEEWVLSL